jgi:hypothetical protein
VFAEFMLLGILNHSPNVTLAHEELDVLGNTQSSKRTACNNDTPRICRLIKSHHHSHYGTGKASRTLKADDDGQAGPKICGRMGSEQDRPEPLKHSVIAEEIGETAD